MRSPHLQECSQRSTKWSQLPELRAAAAQDWKPAEVNRATEGPVMGRVLGLEPLHLSHRAEENFQH